MNLFSLYKMNSKNLKALYKYTRHMFTPLSTYMSKVKLGGLNRKFMFKNMCGSFNIYIKKR